MLKKNENLLLVDYDINRGLLLKWNLAGKNNLTFFRHILIFDVDRQFDAKFFIDQYFQKIKSGDIITLVWFTQVEEFFFLKWRQKSPIAQLQTSKVKPFISTVGNIIISLQQIDKRTADFTEPIIYNFITTKQGKQLKQLQNAIKKWMERKQKFLSNIFAKNQTCIQPTTGINWFNLTEFTQDSDKNWNFFKQYINQISLQRIKITIQCENGNCSSKKQDEWHNIDFNRIARVIHAPSTNYIQDSIQFLNEDSSPQINYILNIHLEFIEHDNHKYSASKKIIINAINQKVYQRTFGGRQIQFASQVFPGFYSMKNPFRSDSLVWFKKDMLV